MTMKIGKAKFGGEFVKKNYWKLKDGESVYRILPPLGDLAESGRWSMFYNVHYGYKNTKGQMRVFQSPLVKDRKTRMISSPDAALERIEKFKAELEKAKQAGNKAVEAKLNELVGPNKAVYNLDNNHYVNAMDEQGNIGILKLRHRAKLALDATIKTLRDSGIDPLDADSGRFLVFRRSGTGLDTSFQVTVKKKQLYIEGVGTVEQDLVHTLTPEIIARLSKEASQLDKLFKRLTSEEVARVVATSDVMTGRSPAVDELFDSSSESHEDHSMGEEEVSEPVAATPVTPAVKTVTVPTATVTVGAPVFTNTAPVKAWPPVSSTVSSSVPPVSTMTPVPTVPTLAPTETIEDFEEFLRTLP